MGEIVSALKHTGQLLRSVDTARTKGTAFRGYVTVVRPPLSAEQATKVQESMKADVVLSELQDATVVLTGMETAMQLSVRQDETREHAIGRSIIYITDGPVYVETETMIRY